MKGLILKDLFVLKQQSRLLTGLVVFYFLYALVIEDVRMLNMIILVSLMLPMITMAYDEKSKWEKYALAMPVTRDTLVLSKYLFAIALLLAGVIAVGAASSLIVFFSRGMNIKEVLMMSVTVGAIGLMFQALILPILFKFGVEKTRVIMMVIVFMPVFLGAMSDRLGISIPGDGTLTLGLYLLPLVIVLFMFISIKLSLTIYHKKEF